MHDLLEEPAPKKYHAGAWCAKHELRRRRAVFGAAPVIHCIVTLRRRLLACDILRIERPMTVLRSPRPEITPEALNAGSRRQLPGLVGMEVLDVSADGLKSRLEVRPELLSPNGYVHAAALVALADTTCGFGAIAFLPDGARSFTTLELKTSFVGAVRDDEAKAYLRPETAQGMFYNFKNVIDSTRVKVPFGICQVGRSFRNEVTPRNYIFRSREFEQMELEFFVHPSEADRWYQYWRQARYDWWCGLGLAGENLRLRDHEQDELAHYAKESGGCCDVEYAFPFSGEKGFTELEGIAYRSNYDLTQHQRVSGVKLEYFDAERNERYLPHVIEPAAGLTRGVLAVLCEAYTVDETRPSPELMRFHPRLAPVKAGVFPLVNKEGMPEVAERIYQDLRRRVGPCQYDAKQSIGKRYARMDEAGTPFCITVDGQTLTDQTVTVRDRDTGSQVRVASDRVVEWVAERVRRDETFSRRSTA